MRGLERGVLFALVLSAPAWAGVAHCVARALAAEEGGGPGGGTPAPTPKVEVEPLPPPPPPAPPAPPPR